MKMLRDPLFWLIALFVALIFWLPYSQPLFAALFPYLSQLLSRWHQSLPARQVSP
ncbi:hypothetical protein ACUOFC_66370, partial [Escherichia sp. TWPC-MK]